VTFDCEKNYAFPNGILLCSANFKASAIGTVYQMTFCSNVYLRIGSYLLYFMINLGILKFKIFITLVLSFNQMNNYSLNCSVVGSQSLTLTNVNTSDIVKSMQIVIYDCNSI
jgi:hypothetical protein